MFNQPFLPSSPLKFLQIRDTDQPITNCQRLQRNRENFWENPAWNFFNGWIELAKLMSPRVTLTCKKKRRGVFWVAPLCPSSYTADQFSQLTLSQPQVTPLGAWWHQEGKVEIQHLAGTIASVNTSTSVTPWNWTIVVPRCIYARIGFQIHQHYLDWIVDSSEAEVAAGVERSGVTKVGQYCIHTYLYIRI